MSKEPKKPPRSSADLMRDFEKPPSVVERHGWGAAPPVRRQKIEGQAKNVVVTWSDTDTCTSRPECERILREMQEKHVKEEGHPDIKYNWLIGRDGFVYEGRGWGVKTRVSTRDGGPHCELDDQSVYIAFIGPKNGSPTTEMLTALAGLSSFALMQKRIKRDVRIIKLNGDKMEFHDCNMDDLQKDRLERRKKQLAARDQERSEQAPPQQKKKVAKPTK